MVLCLNEAKNTDLALAKASIFNEIQAQKGKFGSKGGNLNMLLDETFRSLIKNGKIKFIKQAPFSYFMT